MMKISAVISAVLLVAGLASAQGNGRDGCRQSLSTCVMPLVAKYGNQFQSPQDAVTFFQFTSINSICGELEVVQQCLQQAMTTTCSGRSDLNEVNFVISAIAYSCGAEGRQVLEAIKLSPCILEVEMLLAFGGYGQQCSQAAEQAMESAYEAARLSGEDPDMAVICNVVNSNIACVLGGAETLCGEAVALYLGNIVELYQQNLGSQPEAQCFVTQQRARSIATRGLHSLLPF